MKKQSLFLILTLCSFQQPTLTCAEEISLSLQVREQATRQGDELIKNVFKNPTSSDPSYIGREVLIVGRYVGKGDQVIQMKNESANIEYFVNYPKTMHIASPSGEMIQVHGVVEAINVPSRQVTIRGMQVDAPPGSHAQHQ